MTALRGAAGDEPRLTALLLAAGADPDDERALHGAAGAADHGVRVLWTDGLSISPARGARPRRC